MSEYHISRRPTRDDDEAERFPRRRNVQPIDDDATRALVRKIRERAEAVEREGREGHTIRLDFS